MPARDRISRPAQIFRQVLLHAGRRVERYRVQVRVEFRQEAEAVAFDRWTALVPALWLAKCSSGASRVIPT